MDKNNEGASTKLAPFWKGKIIIAYDETDIKRGKELNKPIIAVDNGDNSSSLWGADYVVTDYSVIDEELAERVYKRYMGIPWTIAETNRCIIREFAMSDLDALFELYSKPGITDFVEPLYDYEKEYEYESAYIKHMYGYFEYGMWLVFSKETGKLIGRAGIENRDYEDASGDSYHSEIELGYLVAPEYQRKGYATEICKAILSYAYDNLEFDRINCLINSDNTASISFIEKLGFKYMEKTTVTGEELVRYVIYKENIKGKS